MRLLFILFVRYHGGLEIQTWSNLPRGSGMGTSSILAGIISTLLLLQHTYMLHYMYFSQLLLVIIEQIR